MKDNRADIMKDVPVGTTVEFRKSTNRGWVEISREKSCKHSWVECQGIGGGWVFQRCNKCGITKD